MDIIIAGAGTVGITLARQLAAENHNITIVDQDRAVLDEVTEQLDAIAVCGNCASREVLLVLDGTTGQNGLIQAKEFKNIAGVTALALTKLDGTAKGGIVIAVADSLQIPVKFIGVGEQVDDLVPFDAESFVEALL